MKHSTSGDSLAVMHPDARGSASQRVTPDDMMCRTEHASSGVGAVTTRLVFTLALALMASGCTDFDDALAAFCDGGRCGLDGSTQFDAGRADAGTSDGGGSSDAGSADGGRADGGVSDGGASDGGTSDAGRTDAGFNDGGLCFNGLKDPLESDTDCGGACDLCGLNATCDAGASCASGVCHTTSFRCVGSTCGDGARTGDETDLDCGGTCATKCGVDAGCGGNGDCTSGVCNLTAQRCATSTCGDGARSGDESDIDCGGSCTVKCGLDAGCAMSSDCANAGVCHTTRNRCVVSACFDGARSTGETDIDCGGTCGGCGLDAGCSMDTNCISGICNGSQQRCVATRCEDGLKNGQETDVDCSGSCAACTVGKQCATGPNCDTGSCGVYGRCQLAPLEWQFNDATDCQRTHAIAATVGDSIYAGGRLFNCGSLDPTNPVERYAPFASTPWGDAAPITLSPRRGMVMLPLPAIGRVVVLGGFSDNETSTSRSLQATNLLGPFRGDTSTLMTSPSGRGFPAAAVMPNGRIFVAGGHAGDLFTASNALSTTEVFTPVALSDGGLTGTWDAGPNLGIFRCCGGTAVTTTHVLVMGGLPGINNGSAALDNIEAFPFDGGLPVALPPMPRARAYFGAATGSDGRVYVVGGQFSDGGMTASVDVYDPQTQQWATTLDLPEVRSAGALVVGPDNRLYFINGVNAMSTPTSSVFVYGPRLTLTPSSGPRDAGISVTGFDYRPSELVEVRLGSPSGPVLAAGPASSSGNLSSGTTLTFKVPNLDAGVYDIFAADVKSRYPVKAKLTVTP
ncbi:MAG: hypothetical protein JNG84_02350 [Archangium sp.]|nr:hypothetical protein [Archangium sp.]